VDDAVPAIPIISLKMMGLLPGRVNSVASLNRGYQLLGKQEALAVAFWIAIAVAIGFAATRIQMTIAIATAIVILVPMPMPTAAGLPGMEVSRVAECASRA
jgi:hypothetical protein